MTFTSKRGRISAVKDVHPKPVTVTEVRNFRLLNFDGDIRSLMRIWEIFKAVAVTHGGDIRWSSGQLAEGGIRFIDTLLSFQVVRSDAVLVVTVTGTIESAKVLTTAVVKALEPIAKVTGNSMHLHHPWTLGSPT